LNFPAPEVVLSDNIQPIQELSMSMAKENTLNAPEETQIEGTSSTAATCEFNSWKFQKICKNIVFGIVQKEKWNL
jgi:hypothetical protein